MIRSYFGLQRHPFDSESVDLLPHQQQVLDILLVHAQQGAWSWVNPERASRSSSKLSCNRTPNA